MAGIPSLSNVKPVVVDERYRYEIEKVREDLHYLIYSKQCAPTMLRLAFHDAATGGPNGSIRLSKELELSCNNGLKAAVDLCEEIKAQHPIVSYADIYQLAGVVAVQLSGGPVIDFVAGREDSYEGTKEGRLLDDGDDISQLRDKFNRMRLGDRDIVALAGARTLLRAHADRSNYDAPWSTSSPRFDNSYFKELQLLGKQREGLLELPSDEALLSDAGFFLHVNLYAKSEHSFFCQYAQSHKKLSELGFIQPAAFPSPATHKKKKKKKKQSNMLATSLIVGIMSLSAISAAVLILRSRAK